MKILCVIDHFGSGGAQRQMVNLACGLKCRGHKVEMLIYFPEHSFFRQQVMQAGIPIHELRKGRGFSFNVLWELVRLLRAKRFNGVISFLGTPNVYAELACLACPSRVLIVSERSSHHGDKHRMGALIRRILHGLADFVITNSYSHASWLCRYPWLDGKTRTVYNGYPLEVGKMSTPDPIPPLSLLVVGRVGPEKNGLRLIEALKIFHRRHGYLPQVSWAGKEDTRPSGVAYCQQLHQLLDNSPDVKAHWHWLGERPDIPALLRQHRALIHPSLYEGLPNVVCEALMESRPVLVSNVCDHPLLVEDGSYGFLFDPVSIQSIAHAIERLTSLTDEQWRQFAINARLYAEENLSINRMVDSYESLLNRYST